MRPLRFCMVTTFYPPYSYGGDGITVQRLARALVRAGPEVTVVHDADADLSLGHPMPSAPATAMTRSPGASGPTNNGTTSSRPLIRSRRPA